MRSAAAYDRRATGRLVKQLDEERKAAVEQLKHAAYFHRQVAWLQDRFPKAELEAVPGLVKLVTAKTSKPPTGASPRAVTSVSRQPRRTRTSTSSRAIAEIHEELAALNTEAADLATKIQNNFEELGV